MIYLTYLRPAVAAVVFIQRWPAPARVADIWPPARDMVHATYRGSGPDMLQLPSSHIVLDEVLPEDATSCQTGRSGSLRDGGTSADRDPDMSRPRLCDRETVQAIYRIGIRRANQILLPDREHAHSEPHRQDSA